MLKFIGFDPLKIDSNGFELYKDNRYMMSLYHDLSLAGYDYSHASNFSMYLRARKGSENCQSDEKWLLNFANTTILKIESRGEGNFEDVNDLSLLDETINSMVINIGIGAMNIVLETQEVSFTPDPTGDDWLYGKQ